MSAPYSDATNAGKLFSKYVTAVYWFNPTAIGDDFVITDGKGKVLLEGQAEGVNKSQWFSFPKSQFWADFQLTVLTAGSGKLYIYFSKME